MGQRAIVAIRKRQLLRVQCAQASVLVEPHAYGVAHAGWPLLLCYELTRSATGAVSGWRCLNLLHAVSVDACSGGFAGPRPGYRRDHPAFHTIFAQL